MTRPTLLTEKELDDIELNYPQYGCNGKGIQSLIDTIRVLHPFVEHLANFSCGGNYSCDCAKNARAFLKKFRGKGK